MLLAPTALTLALPLLFLLAMKASDGGRPAEDSAR